MGSGKLRLAVAQDIPRIIDMIEALARSVDGPQRVDRETAGNSLMSHIMDSMAVVFMTDGGFISGRIISTVINPEPVAFETGWYARDRSGIRLLRAFEAWSRDKGAALVTMSCNGGSAQQILQRCGYRSAEIHMVKQWQSFPR